MYAGSETRDVIDFMQESNSYCTPFSEVFLS